MQRVLAIDIGASGGRHILGSLRDGRIHTEEVYRFPNGMVKRGGRLCWDLPRLFGEIVEGLKRCAEAGTIPSCIGIDTWGVDFVLLDGGGELLGDSVAYRDKRTEGIDETVDRSISEQALYARTGIQKQPFNTLYQLAALQKQEPGLLERAERLLMIPEYLSYLLTGVSVSEYTIAGTTGLVGVHSRDWDGELLDILGFPKRLFGKLCEPGTLLGGLLPAVRAVAGFDCAVRLPAAHDTAAAFLSVPFQSEQSVCISSGTWSLLGTESFVPFTGEQSRAANFSNEGGLGKRYRLLKNIMGLWMLQSLRHEAGDMGFREAMERAAASGYTGIVNVNQAAFLAPDNMGEAVRDACRTAGCPEPAGIDDLLRCVYQSLAHAYAQALGELEGITGRHCDVLHIIGGGCRDTLLNRLTADVCRVPVYAGPAEGTALGNILSLLLATGELSDLASARRLVRDSFEIKEYGL